MYTDLRMFDLANEYLGSGDSADRRLLIKVEVYLFLNALKWINF